MNRENGKNLNELIEACESFLNEELNMKDFYIKNNKIKFGENEEKFEKNEKDNNTKLENLPEFSRKLLESIKIKQIENTKKKEGNLKNSFFFNENNEPKISFFFHNLKKFDNSLLKTEKFRFNLKETINIIKDKRRFYLDNKTNKISSLLLLDNKKN